jgi:hypothetical protein
MRQIRYGKCAKQGWGSYIAWAKIHLFHKTPPRVLKSEPTVHTLKKFYYKDQMQSYQNWDKDTYTFKDVLRYMHTYIQACTHKLRQRHLHIQRCTKIHAYIHTSMHTFRKGDVVVWWSASAKKPFFRWKRSHLVVLNWVFFPDHCQQWFLAEADQNTSRRSLIIEPELSKCWETDIDAYMHIHTHTTGDLYRRI